MDSFDGDTKSTGSARRAGGDLWLTVLSDRGLRTYALPPLGRVTIGRAEDCTIVIDDDSLSRNHAALWVASDELEIEDLGSRNGTRVGQRQLSAGERVAVRVGQAIGLGNSTLIMRNNAPDERPRRVLTHDQLEICLESECARAADGGQGFALAHIALVSDETPAPPAVVLRLERLFATGLRPRDLLATYAPGVYEVVFLGCDRAAVSALLLELGSQAASQGLELASEIAVYPGDGRSADELLSAVARLRSQGEADSHALDGPTPQEPSDLLQRVAASDLNVLITGETGAGKEVMAQAIHQLSNRAQRALVSLNCAAFAESLLDSELFGYEKGAFTGAAHDKPGLLESADGGTVFLDEIGEMSLSLQAKLLRVIELKLVQRIGALRPRQLDVRFIAATHRDLEAEVAGGRFRNDLLFRLNGMPMTVPPLRERVDEIEPLAEHFLAAAAARMKLPRPPLLTDATRKALRAYRWPGNVRELRNVIERAVVLCRDGVITPEALPTEKMKSRTLEPPNSAMYGTLTFADAAEPTSTAVPPKGNAALDRRAAASRGLARDEERQRIVAALEETGGNQTEAARLLGISRRTLVNRVEEFGLQHSRRR